MRTLLAFACLLGLCGCGPPRRDIIVVGSKNFTEQLVLGELIAQQIEAHSSLTVERRFYLAGTYICQQAILAGRIDIYPEYTGTALTAVLKEAPIKGEGEVLERVRQAYRRRFNLELTAPFGFNNTFAMEIRGEDARRLKVSSISEAAQFTPQWRAGFGYEFMERPDGYQGLAKTYGLRFAEPPRIMDLGLLARALHDKQIDIAAGNATDGLIPVLDLFVLADDKHYFPPYEAVPVVRSEVLQRHPEVSAALAALGGKISEREMQQLNYAVDGQRRDVKDVVREFRTAKGL